jgi:hypothetical protein
MEKKSKKIFLMATVIVPFLIYCVYYYAHMFKNAPYKFSEFKSIVFQYGTPDSMLNKYDSRTGEYQYVNAHDSVIRMNLHLPKEQLLYLHRKAAELGFWDWPSDERGDTTVRHNGQRAPRYFMQFNYQRKSKTITFDESFIGDPRLKAANEGMIKEIMTVLDDEAGKQKK